MPLSVQESAGSLGTTRMTMSAASRVKRRDPLEFEPLLIGGLKTTCIRKVACGDMFTACLTGREEGGEGVREGEVEEGRVGGGEREGWRGSMMREGGGRDGGRKLILHYLSDKGILMTFGSGANGCLGHGDHNDAKEVSHEYAHYIILVSNVG